MHESTMKTMYNLGSCLPRKAEKLKQLTDNTEEHGDGIDREDIDRRSVCAEYVKKHSVAQEIQKRGRRIAESSLYLKFVHWRYG